MSVYTCTHPFYHGELLRVPSLNSHCQLKMRKTAPALKEPVVPGVEGTEGRQGRRTRPCNRPSSLSYKISEETDIISEMGDDKRLPGKKVGSIFLKWREE